VPGGDKTARRRVAANWFLSAFNSMKRVTSSQRLPLSTASPSSQPPSPHRAFAALRTPGFAIYLAGSALAMMADSIEHVISYWMIYEEFQSPALGGYAVISHWLPFLLFSLISGALADRYDPRRIIQIGMMLFMLCSLAWGVLFLTDSLQVWHAALIFSIHGMAGVLWSPASQILVHDIAGRDQLHSAVRLLAVSRTLGLIGGPAIGGVMLLTFGPITAILLNVLVYLPLTIWLWRAPYGRVFRGEPRPTPRDGGGLAGILATARAIAGNRIVVSMTLLSGAVSFAVGNAYQAQMPEFAADLGHGDADFYYTMLLGANAIGALTAGILLELRPFLSATARTAFWLVIIWCLCIAGFAVSRNYSLSLLLLFVAGFLNLAFGAMAQALVQINAPQDIRGRVVGLFNMSMHGMRAFSGVTIGMGGSLVGIHWSLAVSTIVLLLVTIGLYVFEVRPGVPKTAQ
jgi:MFS family permease